MGIQARPIEGSISTMNERIRELAYRAANGMLSYDAEGEWRLSEQECNKFAELIVRECAELVKDFYQEDEFTCYSAATEIKEHFGVEE